MIILVGPGKKHPPAHPGWVQAPKKAGRLLSRPTPHPDSSNDKRVVSQATSDKRKAVLVILANGLVMLLVMAMAPWVLPFYFLLACVVSMGVTALIHILVTVQARWGRRWRTVSSVQEIICAGRYRLGEHQVEIDRLRGEFSLLLTSDDRQAEYRFANLPTLRLYLDAVLPRS